MTRLSFAGGDGPLLHYTFDEGQGNVLRDQSGHGFNGEIHGATYVKSPRGFALQFNGVDNYVDLGNPPGLNLTGDLTIEAWLKTSPGDQRNRLIIGDTASLSKDRNYSLRIDVENLFFEWGDNQRSSQIARRGPVLHDEWEHLVLICEAPKYFIYLNGREIEQGERPMPFTPTKGAARRIGGWEYGFFKGAIDELKLYNRALTKREILASYAGKPLAEIALEPEIAITPRLAGYNRDKSGLNLGVEVFCQNLKEPNVTAEVLITKGAAKKPCAKQVVPLPETRPGSERRLANAMFADVGLPAGDYQIGIVLKDHPGRIITSTQTKAVYPEKPAWLSSKAGIGNEVLPPWTPVQTTASGDKLSVSTWGREYTFGTIPFLCQMESRSVQLLTGPARLLATVDGEELAWQCAKPRLESRKPDRAVVTQRLKAAKAEVSIKNEIEYDGFMRVDWNIQMRKDGHLDHLALELPLDGQCAKYFYCWPTASTWNAGYSGSLTNWVSRFRPIIWIGDEDRGLTWVAESDQNWSLVDPEKAIQVIKKNDEAVLRFNLIDRPQTVKAGEMLNYTCGLQATPVKPPERSAWNDRLIYTKWYAEDLRLPKREIAGQPALKYYADKGARALMIMRWWEPFSYMLPLGHEAEFKTLVGASHAAGLKVVPYAAGFLLSELAPEYRDYQDVMLTKPLQIFPISPPYNSQITYFTCPNSEVYRDFVAGDLVRLIEQYDADGIYLDSTTMATPCNNAFHGCGYLRADGTRAPTYPVFGIRELLKRIYTIVRKHKPEGIVDVHPYDALTIPALSFATSYWLGEQVKGRGNEFKPEVLPLDRFRTEFMGRNLGISAEFLHYELGGFQQSLAIALLHDVLVRGDGPLEDFETTSSIWRLRDEFGCSNAQWFPYWNNARYVKVSPTECYASLYRHPKNGVLAVVSNLGRQDARIVLALQLSALGLPASFTAKDGLTGQAVEADPQSNLVFNLPSQRWKTIWIK